MKKSTLLFCLSLTICNTIYSQDWDQSKTVELFTGDDCDKIISYTNYSYANGNDPKNTKIKFTFTNGSSAVRWWKKIEIPVKGGKYRAIEFEIPNKPNDYITVDLKELDFTRRIRVYKAKLFGIKTKLNYTISLQSLIFTSTHNDWAIYNVNFRWEKDKCGN